MYSRENNPRSQVGTENPIYISAPGEIWTGVPKWKARQDTTTPNWYWGLLLLQSSRDFLIFVLSLFSCNLDDQLSSIFSHVCYFIHNVGIQQVRILDIYRKYSLRSLRILLKIFMTDYFFARSNLWRKHLQGNRNVTESKLSGRLSTR